MLSPKNKFPTSSYVKYQMTLLLKVHKKKDFKAQRIIFMRSHNIFLPACMHNLHHSSKTNYILKVIEIVKQNKHLKIAKNILILKMLKIEEILLHIQTNKCNKKNCLIQVQNIKSLIVILTIINWIFKSKISEMQKHFHKKVGHTS